jgi:hypothetical protein
VLDYHLDAFFGDSYDTVKFPTHLSEIMHPPGNDNNDSWIELRSSEFVCNNIICSFVTKVRHTFYKGGYLIDVIIGLHCAKSKFIGLIIVLYFNKDDIVLENVTKVGLFHCLTVDNLQMT